ncbi:MAG: hypothetical protein M1820_009669 [Bogoriella megaspora]|nr:MAG: hypothetical protein M1820_009669 [Bogoriella megaspora]
MSDRRRESPRSSDISGKSNLRNSSGSDTKARPPSEWNWEGVWEERVKKGIQSSISDSILYGSNTTGDDVIQFLELDPEFAKEAASQAYT